jgi:hypothetical protein
MVREHQQYWQAQIWYEDACNCYAEDDPVKSSRELGPTT